VRKLPKVKSMTRVKS